MTVALALFALVPTGAFLFPEHWGWFAYPFFGWVWYAAWRYINE